MSVVWKFGSLSWICEAPSIFFPSTCSHVGIRANGLSFRWSAGNMSLGLRWKHQDACKTVAGLFGSGYVVLCWYFPNDERSIFFMEEFPWKKREVSIYCMASNFPFPALCVAAAFASSCACCGSSGGSKAGCSSSRRTPPSSCRRSWSRDAWGPQWSKQSSL